MFTQSLLLILLLSSVKSFAQGTSEASLAAPSSSEDKLGQPSNGDDDVIYVIGSQEKAFYTPGSAHFIDQKELKKFNYEDVNRILDKVPGVYIQEEDGLGLRPNIGVRGAHPVRSKKITIMEDGILMGPAPYSAPAAYYFPSTNRMSSMEVFKGPSSVKYGPNSVGGAINMVTKLLDGPQETQVEMSGGTFNQAVLLNRGSLGNFSWLVQASRKEGDLLRSLPSGEDVDFEQNDFLVKLGQKLPGYNQRLEFKFSFADEDSDETYLGTSTADFNNDAFTRYAASQDDNLQWQRYAIQGSYSIKPASWIKAKSTVYHHQMRRNWVKFNNLFNRQDFRTALNNDVDPDNIIGLLRGDRDSRDDTERLRIGSNDRTFFSQGVQSQVDLSLNTGPIAHELQIGLRLHRDQVARNHTEQAATMVDGELIYDEVFLETTSKNKDRSEAIALFLEDEIITGNLTTKIGARVEQVDHRRDPRGIGQNPVIETNTERVFVPGIGFNYSVNNDLVLLGGVNKGITLVGPGQSEAIENEVAINYEAGFRLKAPFYMEAIAFYSDYKNLKGSCTFAEGCDESQLDVEFNGGAGEIFGLESIASHEFAVGAFRFPVRLGYTFTVARFNTSFANSNPAWGPTEENNIIRAGDPMPYVPQNQISFGTGVSFRKFAMDINMLWKDQVADQSVAEGRRLIPSYGVVDTAFSYQYNQKGRAFLRVNNILDNTYLVGLRPFGLRPGSPRTIVAGFNQTF